MEKSKIVIDPRYEDLTVRPKVEVRPDPENPDFMLALDHAMSIADWSDDPGTGRAVLLPDGRELLNPTPVAPPAIIAAYSEEMSVNDLVARALARHNALLKGNDEIDTEEDLDDFPEDDDYHPITMYEAVLMRDEAPAIPPGEPLPLESAEPIEELKPPKAAKKKAADAASEEGEGGE